MSSYNITITNNGAGVYTPVVRRAGTAASGGTVLALPAAALFPSTTATLLLGLAVDVCKRRALNIRAASPTVSFSIDIIDTAGSFAPTIRSGGTPASGGTVLTLPLGELFPGTTTPLLGLAFDVAKRRARNDRAAGN